MNNSFFYRLTDTQEELEERWKIYQEKHPFFKDKPCPHKAATRSYLDKPKGETEQ